MLVCVKINSVGITSILFTLYNMKTNSFEVSSTNDEIIRVALKKNLQDQYVKDNHPVKIFEELGLKHGTVRVDIAVVNGVMHGYEIKSDRDTLQRLPEQMNVYNSVFDQVTIVVGKSHLYEVINIVPDWWGIIVAKIDSGNSVFFNHIREAGNNLGQDKVSIARFLWREEALEILEERNEAHGFRSKPRAEIYEKLANILDKETLGDKVRETLLFSRLDWRPDAPLMLSDD